MYHVLCKRTALWAVLCILLAFFVLLGFAGTVVGVAGQPRELPIYSVDTTEKVAALGINCAWADC